MRAALLVMAKRPYPGHTKSRLTPPLSEEQAAELYKCFLKDAIDLASSLPVVQPIIAFAPPEEACYFKELAPEIPRIPQLGATLGERLDYVLTACLQKGFIHVVAMNSDSPTLPPTFLEQAFERLAEEETDVVLGPCDDGGYYLIGWKRPHPALVREVRMSTNHVLDDTLNIAAAANLRVALLQPWYDVDDEGGLQRLRHDLPANASVGRYTRAYLNDK
jgi:rSAM/selenodomain-associated transferase 1